MRYAYSYQVIHLHTDYAAEHVVHTYSACFLILKYGLFTLRNFDFDGVH